MNPWGVLLILFGALSIYIGIKGTENGVYAFVFGHAISAYNNTPFAPGSDQSQQNNNSNYNPNSLGYKPHQRNV